MYMNNKGEEMVREFDPRTAGWTFVPGEEVSQEKRLALWQVPAPMTDSNVLEWSGDNQYNFHRENKEISVEINGIDLSLNVLCVLQSIYGKVYLHYMEPKVVKVNGHEYGAKDKSIITDEFSCPEKVKEQAYEETVSQALAKEYSLVSLIGR